ncbi:class I SAM-dependent methyltransferase [Cellulomonas alba]|uniref:Class I SAM-dependent methyltransferase n=1 Tax=Cellulomonas alba TaxID=3053467 RepID=A0ABT7SK85_9CELL|nr:class I SAM-dependent methyltransferase [Cellulomonas alba]MDM7856599.1 class I SAM-dependent methyltransferase [Cellulomonas alba]
MTDRHREERAASFERGAAVYAATRPSYPDDAVAWCVPARARDALDLAAGTGKLTASLVARGLDVVAVEPSDAMRGELVAVLPGVDARTGTAEATGLPDASVDVVTVGQAWHWFDEAAAAAECARVLRPGGVLAVLWNLRDEAVDWMAAFSVLLHRGDALDPARPAPVVGDAFGPVEGATFRWSQPFRPTDLRGLAASRSHLLTLPEAERDAILDEVDELAAIHPALRGRDVVDFPYVTHCWRATRR